ncbi:MAG: RNA chaperone Hfq [Bryobacterales bacterium]|nr:RNA chaperone Hfq [Bryobacterales bacterium]
MIRPPLKEMQEKLEASKRTPPPKPSLKPPVAAAAAAAASAPVASAPPAAKPPSSGGPPATPPESTNAENFYFAKQIQMKTPMMVILRDGEELSGSVEWYDKYAFRLARPSAPAVMIYKHNVKFMYKAE